MNGFPKFDLTGQVALVTGAARGLGKAISLALANAGADVAIGLRDVNAQGDVAAQIKVLLTYVLRKVVGCESRIVDQDVDPSEMPYCVINSLKYLIEASHVHL